MKVFRARALSSPKAGALSFVLSARGGGFFFSDSTRVSARFPRSSRLSTLETRRMTDDGREEGQRRKKTRAANDTADGHYANRDEERRAK